MRMLRSKGVSEKNGRGRSSNYNDVRAGLLTPPIKVGDSSLWPEFEIDVLNAARIAGKSDDEIREIVKELVANRANALDEVRARSRQALAP